MIDENLAQRRSWFRFFPEGSIEFIAIIRVLALILLASLLLVGGTQRPTALVAIAVVLWLDYALMLWWLVQISIDLDDLFQQPPAAPPRSDSARIVTWLLGIVPLTMAALLIAPWPQVLIDIQSTRDTLLRVLVPLLVCGYIASAFVAARFLGNLQVGSFAWRLLLLVPVAHWFALHRMLPGLKRRITARGAERGAGALDEGGETSIVLADITLVIAAICWLIVLLGGFGALGRVPMMFGYAGGLFFGAVFAIADVAAMEGAQRPFVMLLRRLQ